MTPATRFALAELERQAGVPARQIRELVRLGLLPNPSSQGRGAFYGEEHLDRLRVWKRLRAEMPPGTTNEQLRVLLNKLHDARLLKPIAEGSIPLALIDDFKADASVVLADPARPLPDAAVPPRALASAVPDRSPRRVNEEALDYLRSVRGREGTPAARLAVPASALEPRLELGLSAAGGSDAPVALARLRDALAAYVAAHAASVRVKPARAETWHRVVVGRDLEITARGPLTPDELQLLEAVGQLLQHAIYRKEP